MEIFRYVDITKETVRTGWLEAGIHHGETIAEHMYHSALIAAILEQVSGDDTIDWNTVKNYCLIHDLGEAITGDVPTPRKTERDRTMEMKALRKILSGYWRSLDHLDIEEIDSIEKKLYKYSEQMATLVQGAIYYKRGYRNDKVLEIINTSIKNIEDLSRKIGREWIYRFTNEIINWVTIQITQDENK